MLKRIRSLLGNRSSANDDMHAGNREPASDEITIEGMPPFPLAQHLVSHHGFPMLDWDAVQVWLEQAGTTELLRGGWDACERGWLLHLRDALGGRFALSEAGEACLLSSLKPNLGRAALDYMNRTQGRVARVLHGMSSQFPLGKDILIVFEDKDSYYAYASYFYSEEGGEFAGSDGMFVSRGCAHYITQGNSLSAIEPIIAHEMTHGQLSHLTLPRWLDEGIAVNVEQRLTRSRLHRFTPREMHEKHLALWDEQQIQNFWCGDSFHDSNDDNQQLAYDLARLLVAHLSGDWARFTHFVLNAKQDDGGAQASLEHLGMDLGHIACAMLERQDAEQWSPDPEKWRDGPA